MPRIAYERKKFNPVSLAMIEAADQIMEDYARQGFATPTLRQLYYQFVAHNLFPEDRKWSRLGSGRWVKDPEGTKNAEPNYNWLGVLLNDGRMAGLLDWDLMIDRTRNLQRVKHWKNPEVCIQNAKRSYQENKWKGQKNYVEVWIEKEALIGVIWDICIELDVPFFACKGYVSQSEMWGAAYHRFARHIENGKEAWILHLGDHDPSGINMSQDIKERISTFLGGGLRQHFHVRRLALNMSQIEAFDPPLPPNPAKTTDARYKAYQDRFGDESWELDALSPATIVSLVRRGVSQLCDQALFDQRVAEQEANRDLLSRISKNLPEIKKFLKGLDNPEASMSE